MDTKIENFNLDFPLKYISINQPYANPGQVYTDLGMKGHDGIDFFAVDGTPVYATHDGRVVFAGYDSSRGLGIRIRTEELHTYGDQQVYPATIYWHLKTDSLKVTGGQTVKRGDLIAFADNTGLSTGSHLHFALEPLLRSDTLYDFTTVHPDNGYRGYIDPKPYLPVMLDFKTELGYGDTGFEVEKVQAYLVRNGYLVMPPNTQFGYFGLLTAAAVLKLQLANSIIDFRNSSDLRKVRVGPKTLAVLNLNLAA